MQVWTSGQICRRYKISRQTFKRNWRTDPAFPKPLTYSRNQGGVWERRQVQRWANRKKSRKGGLKLDALDLWRETRDLDRIVSELGCERDKIRAWLMSHGEVLPVDDRGYHPKRI